MFSSTPGHHPELCPASYTVCPWKQSPSTSQTFTYCLKTLLCEAGGFAARHRYLPGLMKKIHCKPRNWVQFTGALTKRELSFSLKCPLLVAGQREALGLSREVFKSCQFGMVPRHTHRLLRRTSKPPEWVNPCVILSPCQRQGLGSRSMC